MSATDVVALRTLTAFDRATSVTPTTESGRFEADLDPAWSALRGLLGGYVVAVLLTAADATLDGQAVRSVSASFLRPAEPGPAVVVVEPLRVGRTVASLHVTLEQGGRLVLDSRVTASRSGGGAAAGTVAAGWSTPWHGDVPPPERCVPLQPPTEVAHFAQAEAVLDPADTPFTSGPRARTAGHLRPREARPIDAPWLAMALDWLPPSPFARFDRPAGGVSVDYDVHVHRVLTAAPEGWLTGVLESRDAVDGMVLEHGTIATAEGLVLAESFHTRLLAG